MPETRKPQWVRSGKCGQDIRWFTSLEDRRMSDDLVKRLREDQPVTQDMVSTMQCALQDAAADRIEELEAKLATCEKYRDAYAECDRIGTQAVREFEAKLAKAVEALVRIDEASNHYCMTSTCSEGTLRYAHQSTRNLARATLAELEGKG